FAAMEDEESSTRNVLLADAGEERPAQVVALRGGEAMGGPVAGRQRASSGSLDAAGEREQRERRDQHRAERGHHIHLEPSLAARLLRKVFRCTTVAAAYKLTYRKVKSISPEAPSPNTRLLDEEERSRGAVGRGPRPPRVERCRNRRLCSTGSGFPRGR